MVPWPSGKAKVCNTSIPGSIPGGASKKSRTPIGVLLFLTCYARSEPCHVRKAHGIRFATFAPRAVRNSGYISHDLDGREKYLRKFLYFSFWERAESGSHSPPKPSGSLLTSGWACEYSRIARNSGDHSY